jgi:FKBP-type peptidyl-prolyl cis-trans isomerase
MSSRPRPRFSRAASAVAAPIVVAIALACADGESAAQDQTASTPGTMEERASYAIGFNLGRTLRNDEIPAAIEQIAQGLRDGFAEAEPKITEADMGAAMQEMQQLAKAALQERQTAAGAKNREEGAAFLASNSDRAGVVTLPSGLQYEVLTTGTGPKPSPTDVVRVHYRGTTIDGLEFDSSHERGQPAVFPLERVISGWTEGLQLMTVGSKWKLFVPSALAYGSSAPPGAKFGPDSVLVFEIELLGIENKGD